MRTTRGIKGTRQKIIIMHNPNEIDQSQLLLVRFLNLGSDDVIIPGMANLSFNIELSLMVNPKRALVSNVDRAIVKKFGVDDFEVFVCCRDLWKTVKKAEDSETRHNP